MLNVDEEAWQLFTGGTIRTIDTPGTVEAVLIAGDKIIATGSISECRTLAPSSTTTVDLGGATMLPGFVDAHTHPLMLGQCASWADLTGATSIDDVVKLLREHAGDVETGPVRGFGYDHHRLGTNDAHPTNDDLDRVSTDRPVEIMHASGHGYVVNSVSLAAAAIDESTPTPNDHVGWRLPGDRTRDDQLAPSARHRPTQPASVDDGVVEPPFTSRAARPFIHPRRR